MAEITNVLFLRHLRSEPSGHVIRYRGGKVTTSERGVAFWFMPMTSSISEVPCDDREVTFMFHGRSSDFQDVTAQGTIAWRVVDPEVLANRIDFSIDLDEGFWIKSPLEQISGLMTSLAQQLATGYISKTPVRELLVDGASVLREQLETGLQADERVTGLGLTIVGVGVHAVSPTAEVEKALQTPTREMIQQSADEATFQRRAFAVEKERAIQENEMQNRIELAKREETLIAQQGQNTRREAEEEAEAGIVRAKATAERKRLASEVQADGIRLVKGAENEAESARMTIYRELPSRAMWGLAGIELAGKLPPIEHLNIAPDMLGPVMTNLVRAGTRHLDATTPEA